MLRTVAMAALLGACGPSIPPRTSVTSSAAEVSVAESQATLAKPPEEVEQDPLAGVVDSSEPAERRGGGLVVRATPDSPTPNAFSSFRRHVEGELGLDDQRTWVGAKVPDFVPLTDATLELTLLDPVDTGFVALYRAPVGDKSCAENTADTCASLVVHYSATGKILWRYELAPLLQRTKNIEVRDLRYVKPIVYFNQACPSWSKDDPMCGVIVALDTETSKVAWRSRPNVSSTRLLVFDEYIVSSATRDKKNLVTLVGRRTGEVLARLETTFLATELDLEPGGLVLIRDRSGASLRLQVIEGTRLAPAPSTAVP